MKLKKPPVIEAWVEFRFAAKEDAKAWDIGFSNHVVRTVFDNEFQIANFSLTPQMTVVKEDGQPALRGQVFFERFRAFNQGKSICLQAGREVLVINMLRTAEEWPEFEVLLEKSLDVLRRYVLFSKPQRLIGVSLHYRDVVSIPLDGTQIRLEDYFAIYPQIPSEYGSTQGVRIDVSLTSQKDSVLRLSLRDIPAASISDAAIAKFQFDWHCSSLHQFGCENIDVLAKSVGEWLSSAHRHIIERFRSAFTEKCWNIFEPVSE